MTHILHPVRPARAAIAAVLALTTTPLLAQEAPAMPNAQATQQTAPPAAPPIISDLQRAQPQAAPPAASLPGDPAPLASAIAPVELLPIPRTAVTKIAPPAAIATPKTAPVRTSPVRPPAAVAKPAPAERAPAPAPTAPTIVPMPDGAAVVPMLPSVNVPVQTAQPQTSASAAAVNANTSSNGGSGEAWGWMAALLAALGLGGGAIVLSRGRTSGAASGSTGGTAPIDRDNDMVPLATTGTVLADPHDRPHDRSHPARTASPAVAANPAIAANPAVAGSAALTRLDQPAMQQSMTPQPMRPMTANALPAAPRASENADDIDHRRLEYLIAQRPSRDNPFVTRTNRKRRALFLLHNRYPMQSAA